MSGWLREPLLLFFVAGGVLFLAAERFFGPAQTSVTLSDDGLAILISEYEMLTGSSPDEKQRKAIIADYFRREVLYREGLREGLHETEPRLRTAIVERMQQRVSGELSEPTPRDLVNFYADNMERYYREASMSIEQRFLANAPQDAEGLLAALERGEEPNFDPSPGGDWLPAYGESLLRTRFGRGTLERLRRAPLQRWIGPVESRRGWHFFRVRDRQDARPLAFATVEDQVAADLQAQRLRTRVDEFVDAQRQRYRLELEE